MLVALRFLAAASIGSAAQSAPSDITQLVMIGRSPAIHAEVNGHDAILELDTGSFELRLSPDFAQKWSIDSERVSLKLGDAPKLTLKPLIEEIASPDPIPLASAWAPHSDGIIGLDVLRRFAVGIDTIEGKVALWYGGHLDTKAATAWAREESPNVPSMTRIQLDSLGPDDWYKVQAKVNGHPLSLLLDTGTAYSTVNPSLQKPLGLKIIGSTQVMEIGHSERLKVAMADSISFGPFSADFPVLNVESSDDDRVEGILGTEALGTGKFLIDMPGQSLYMARLPPKRSNPLERRLRAAGLDLFPSGDGSLLTLVKAGSPAAKLGVESGDKLISIGDVTVSEMVASLEAPPDSKRLSRLLSVGIKAFGGDLTVQVQRKKDASMLSLTLPK